MSNTAGTVISVGQCRPDQAAISHFLSTHFSVRVVSADTLADCLRLLEREPARLVLINRKLDIDYSDGLEVLQEIRRHDQWNEIPVMLVSNYAEWQEKAVSLGAVYGFGKAELNQNQTRERLAAILTHDGAVAPHGRR